MPTMKPFDPFTPPGQPSRETLERYVKGELSRRLNMRRTPEVIFQLDRGIEKGTSVLGLLNQLEQQRQERGEIPDGSDQLDDDEH